MLRRTIKPIALLGSLLTYGLHAQESRINTNLGAGVTVPLNPTGQFADPSGNIVVGAGYNFTKHHSFVGQFMWANLHPNHDLLREFRLAVNDRRLETSSNLYTLTANYRFQKEGHRFGAYVIAGGGAYWRHSRLSREVIVGRETVCTPLWTWWGFRCFSGFVTDDETLVSNTSTAFGGNAGVGFTIRITDDGYKFYIESRYHYAPTSRIATTLIPITLGFSW